MGGCALGFRQLIENTVQAWTRHANIQFQFLEDSSAEIRINVAASTLSKTEGASAVGTLALTIPQDQPSMILPISTYLEALASNGALDQIKGAILHEFGHALGLTHEHQHPNIPFKWNKPLIYALYALSGYAESAVDINFFDAINGPTVTKSAAYDPESIMNYALPPTFFQGCPPAITMNN